MSDTEEAMDTEPEVDNESPTKRSAVLKRQKEKHESSAEFSLSR